MFFLHDVLTVVCRNFDDVSNDLMKWDCHKKRIALHNSLLGFIYQVSTYISTAFYTDHLSSNFHVLGLPIQVKVMGNHCDGTGDI